MTHITMQVPAGPHERFAEDVKLPKVGQRLKVNMPDGTQREGELVSAERQSDLYLRVTIDIKGNVPDPMLPRAVDLGFSIPDED
jgi:hypothetical protein